MAETWLRLYFMMVFLGVIFGYPFNYLYNRPEHGVTQGHSLETTDTTRSPEYWEAEGDGTGAEDSRESESGYEPSDETDDEILDDNQAEQTVTETVTGSDDYREMNDHNPDAITAQEGAGNIKQSASDAKNVGDYGTDNGLGSELESTEYFPDNDDNAPDGAAITDLSTTEDSIVVVTITPDRFWPEQELAVQRARWDEAGRQSRLNDPSRTDVHVDGTESGVAVSSTGRVSAAFMLTELLTMAVCSILTAM